MPHPWDLIWVVQYGTLDGDLMLIKWHLDQIAPRPSAELRVIMSSGKYVPVKERKEC